MDGHVNCHKLIQTNKGPSWIHQVSCVCAACVWKSERKHGNPWRMFIKNVLKKKKEKRKEWPRNILHSIRTHKWSCEWVNETFFGCSFRHCDANTAIPFDSHHHHHHNHHMTIINYVQGKEWQRNSWRIESNQKGISQRRWVALRNWFSFDFSILWALVCACGSCHFHLGNFLHDKTVIATIPTSRVYYVWLSHLLCCIVYMNTVTT